MFGEFRELGEFGEFGKFGKPWNSGISGSLGITARKQSRAICSFTLTKALIAHQGVVARNAISSTSIYRTVAKR